MTRKEAIELLRQHPEGMTTVQVATILADRPDNISSRLSRFAAYGYIQREYVGPLRGPGRYCVWRAPA